MSRAWSCSGWFAPEDFTPPWERETWGTQWGISYRLTAAGLVTEVWQWPELAAVAPGQTRSPLEGHRYHYRDGTIAIDI